MQTHNPAHRGRAWRRHGEGHDSSRQGYQPTTPYKSTINLSSSPPLGALLQTLNEADFLDADRDPSIYRERATITHSEYVASFNWLDRPEPTVLIPGAPPAWTPLKEPRKLEEDKGDHFRDPNAARFPASPQEPAVRSLLTEHENLKTQEIDLFACSSTLGSLLRFVRRVDKPFRFFVEAVGNTVFFTRHENSPTQLIEGVRGYGHTFPEAYTTWDTEVKGSASHQRLLRYDLAGLDCILRFECDGYLPSKAPGVSNATATSVVLQTSEEELDLPHIFDRVNVRSSLGGDEIHIGPLQIDKAGRKIPQEAIFDLKTRSVWRKNLNVLEDELPRYWLAQIHNFILARHTSGVFNDIDVQDIRNDVQKWEEANQEHLRFLVWLLREIMAAVMLKKDKKLEVCSMDLKALEIREQDSDEHNVLSPELKLRWVNNMSLYEHRSGWDDEPTRNKNLPADEFDVSDDGRQCGSDSDEESEKDYTACSADGCGYCGHCSY